MENSLTTSERQQYATKCTHELHPDWQPCPVSIFKTPYWINGKNHFPPQPVVSLFTFPITPTISELFGDKSWTASSRLATISARKGNSSGVAFNFASCYTSEWREHMCGTSYTTYSI